MNGVPSSSLVGRPGWGVLLRKVCGAPFRGGETRRAASGRSSRRFGCLLLRNGVPAQQHRVYRIFAAIRPIFRALSFLQSLFEFLVLWVVAPSRVARSVPLRVFLVGPFSVLSSQRPASAGCRGRLCWEFGGARPLSALHFWMCMFSVLLVVALACCVSGQPSFSPVLLVCFRSTRRASVCVCVCVCLFVCVCV